MDYLQANPHAPENTLEWLPYVLNSHGNELLINNERRPGHSPSDTTPADLGWPETAIPAPYRFQTASSLMRSAIGPLVSALAADFDAGFDELLRYDNLSFRQYLMKYHHWSSELVDFVAR